MPKIVTSTVARNRDEAAIGTWQTDEYKLRMINIYLRRLASNLSDLGITDLDLVLIKNGKAVTKVKIEKLS